MDDLDKVSTVLHSFQHLAIWTHLPTRNNELVKLWRRDIKIETSAVDAIFVKYLQGEERSLTYNELHTYCQDRVSSGLTRGSRGSGY